MDTRNQARLWLHTANWTDGTTFHRAYKELHGEQKWGNYLETQFRIMQNDTLRFAVKWPELWERLTEMYGGKNDV